MRTGTNHFTSLAKAQVWYNVHADTDAPEVYRKIQAGEVAIGRPEEKPGTLVVADSSGRYWVHKYPLDVGATMRFFHKAKMIDARAAYRPDWGPINPWIIYEGGTATMHRGDVGAVRQYMQRKGYTEL